MMAQIDPILQAHTHCSDTILQVQILQFNIGFGAPCHKFIKHLQIQTKHATVVGVFIGTMRTTFGNSNIQSIYCFPITPVP